MAQGERIFIFQEKCATAHSKVRSHSTLCKEDGCDNTATSPRGL